MDKAVRESIAALWEVLWVEDGRSNEEYYEHIITTAHAMRAVMDSGGVSVKDVGDWLRKDALVIEGMGEVMTNGEEEYVMEQQLELAEKVHHQWKSNVINLDSKELKFVESVIGRLRDEQRMLSVKQRKWLYDIARQQRVA